MKKMEDKSICKECGGYCCKKCGCDYFISDFESMKIDYLESILNTGRVSIVAAMDFFRLPNGKLINNPILYMRARNKNRDVIDLLSFKTTCASLEEKGCYFDLDNRPSGGSTLIPCIDKNGDFACYSEIDRLEELNKWRPYQNILQKIVKRHTGMGVNSKLSSDVEKLLIDVEDGNFEDVSDAELLDVVKMIPLLCEAYPDVVLRVKARKDAKKEFVYKKVK